jgi:hypothetical protein
MTDISLFAIWVGLQEGVNSLPPLTVKHQCLWLQQNFRNSLFKEIASVRV